MVNSKRVVVVLPAYNAEPTLRKTISEIPTEVVDEIILVDDFSTDNTVSIAKGLVNVHVFKHESNMGYGANQKTCYQLALDMDADIIVMLHPDYQYTPRLIPSMVHLVASGLYPVVFGSRILGGGALRGGMPIYKYLANRVLTAAQNFLMGQKLSEYHTGYRVFSREVLENINYNLNSDDFVFDNEVIAQICFQNYLIAEITCPTKYFPEASSINFSRSLEYGLGCMGVAIQFFLAKSIGIIPAYLRPR